MFLKYYIFEIVNSLNQRNMSTLGECHDTATQKLCIKSYIYHISTAISSNCNHASLACKYTKKETKI